MLCFESAFVKTYKKQILLNASEYVYKQIDK